jgi:hypothetical protein
VSTDSFERELAGIRAKIIGERGYPTMLLRLHAAKIVTESSDTRSALKSFHDYLEFCSQPNLVLNFPLRWLPTIRGLAQSESLYDAVSEDLCELLRRYYSGYQTLCKSEIQKKNKKRS